MNYCNTLVRYADAIFAVLSLPAEQQLKLGSYFAQTVGADRRFGQELLAHLHKRHKGRIGDEVKRAIRAAGG